jgi:hypothetical protein
MAVHDQLAAVARFNDNWRAPASMVSPPGSPNLLARAFIERYQTSIHVGITVLHDEVIHEDWTGGGSPRALEPAQIV